MGERASLLGREIRPATARVGTGYAPGTFGELLQGVLPAGGPDFLVTFPITEGSRATFRPDPDALGVTVLPAHKTKSRTVAGIILDRYGLPGGGHLDIDSGLPEGKGFASSSADLVATARAVGDAYGMTFAPRTVESFLRRVEPTDGVMYDGIVAFYHRETRLREWLGVLPPLTVIAHDEGGSIDTIGFNRIPKPFDAADRAEYARLLDEIGAAVRAGDLAAVGRVATRSAEMNAKLRPRRHLAVLIDACRDIDGHGVVLAHSGTTVGVLIGADDPERAAKVAHVRAACRPLGGEVSTHRSRGPAD
jgi:L-threonine kinase